MLDGLIDRVEPRLAPHAKAISILAAIWFWVGVGIQARFIPLPDMPRAIEQTIFWAGVAVNAIWWGFLRPAIEQRRAARSSISKGTAPTDPA